MLVVDLHCENGHLFEGWFASGEDLSSQKERGLLSCPACGSHEVSRRPSATRLNVSSLREEPSQIAETNRTDLVPSPSTETAAGGMPVDAMGMLKAAQALYFQAVRHVIAHTEDVGDRFVAEVRSMHHGDAPERAIRGQASEAERAELREEGIEVLAMPIPPELKGPLQ
jgi:hypothetical protein